MPARQERRSAVWVLVAAIAATTVALLPFAGVGWGPHPGFLPAFFSAVLLLDLLSAWMLLAQYRTGGRPRLLLFGAAYAWCAVSLLPHLLVFPGVVTEAGLLGAAPSSAPWLWTTWHAGFALLLAAGALPVPALDRLRARDARGRDVALTLAALVGVSLGVTWLVTAGNALLPTILSADSYARLSQTVGPWVVAACVVAVLLTVLHARVTDGLDRWFAAVAVACLGDVLLTLYAEARFTAGWYVARVMALAAAAIVLLALLAQIARLYSRLESRTAELRRLAHTDELTGLLNRRAVLEAGHRLVGQHELLSVAVIDVDHFKSVNDSLGHDVGDQVLFTVAGRLSRALRVSDEIGRYGGEEFLVLLPDSGLEAAVVAAERLRRAVSAKAVATGGGAVTTSVSIGVARVQPGTGLTGAVAAADAALYEAKRAGRNRVVAAPVSVIVPEPRDRRRRDDVVEQVAR